MLRIEALGAADLRDRIDHLDWEIGRVPNKTSVTFHYNGPAIPGVESWDVDRLVKFINGTDVPNHIQRIGADGLQYHYVCHNGKCYQTRDLDAKLWHCANPFGNAHSIAVHFPLGGAQVVPEHTWKAAIKLAEGLQRFFEMPGGRKFLVGHQEWHGAATACPGGDLMQRIKAYRAMDDFDGQYAVTGDVVNIRQGPGTKYKIALDGKAKMERGALFEVDDAVKGEVIDGNPYWLHRSDGIGFVSARWAQKVS